MSAVFKGKERATQGQTHQDAEMLVPGEDGRVKTEMGAMRQCT